jgi:hypothetical protein
MKNEQELRPFTEKDKKEEIDGWLRDTFLKQFYEQYKHHFKFPDYFPHISFFYIDRHIGKVYLRTYKNLNGRRVYLIYDKNGLFLRKINLPHLKEHPNLLTDIYGDRMFRLVENNDEEYWQLQIYAIK